MRHLTRMFLAFVFLLVGTQLAFAQAATPATDVVNWRVYAAAVGALVLKYVVDLLTHLTNPKDEVKKYLPVALGVLSLVITLLDKYISSSSWGEAAVLGGSGLGAIVVNELGNALKKTVSKPDVVVAPVPAPAPTPAPEVKP